MSIPRICKVDNCDNIGDFNKKKNNYYLRRGLCGKHYTRFRKYGDVDHKYIAFSNHKLYTTWILMRDRCNNPNNPQYHNYGGRGIKVCKEWQGSFESFLYDMGDKPTPQHTLDRINNNGNYEPGNCRWATRFMQVVNTRLNSRNRSGIRGVCRNKHDGKWLAYIGINSKMIALGKYDTKQEAFEARLRGEAKYWP